MASKLFIDANVYLRFFDSYSSEFKKLLLILVELKDEIYITSQIRDEIERNKVDIFIRSFAGYIKNFNFSKISLPEHLGEEKQVSDWNKAIEALSNTFQGQKAKLETLGEQVIVKIASSEDDVSKILLDLYKNISIETSNQIGRAELRKKRGNPPGKNNDPLGDQLSWEQLLDSVNTFDQIWIVTGDSDYFHIHNKKVYLNPILKSDLLARNSSLRIELFNSLSEGLKKFTEANPKRKILLPKEEDMVAIKKEENFIIEHVKPLSGSTGTYQFNPANMYLEMKQCPKYGHTPLVGPMARPSGAGYMSWQYYCPQCIAYYDTGDPYD